MAKTSDKHMQIPTDVWDTAERLLNEPGPELTVILRSAPRRSVNVVTRAALARGMAILEADAASLSAASSAK